MDFTQQDYLRAIDLLSATGIVSDNKYEQVYSGYFSSIGPDMTNGILTAVALYESKPKDAESGLKKVKVCKAILNLVKTDEEDDLILYSWTKRNLSIDKALTEYKIEKAITLLKITIRLFEEV